MTTDNHMPLADALEMLTETGRPAMTEPHRAKGNTMNTTEDFKNAPLGAIATIPYGGRAMKIYDGERRWITSRGIRWNDKEMELRGYTLGPAPAPTTAREALDLAWELAHEVEEGQIIPAGMDYLVSRNGGRPATMRSGLNQRALKSDERHLRTLDPLPDPEPDWLDAPAVLATCGCRGIELWRPHDEKDGMWVSARGEYALWSTLRDVTPLYPREDV